MEPRSVLGKEDSTVLSEIVAGVICGSHGSAGVGDIRFSQVVHFLNFPARP